MKNFGAMKAQVILPALLLLSGNAIGIGVNPKDDPANVYKYLKDESGNCVTYVNGCGGNHSLTQYETRDGFSGFPYGLPATYSASQTGLDLDGTSPNVSKYSGNLATYTAKHAPVAIRHGDYTYFVYSGSSTLSSAPTTVASTHGSGNVGEVTTTDRFKWTLDGTKKSSALSIFVSRAKHQTNGNIVVEKPVLIHSKYTDDPHDNAVIGIDGSGYLYVLIAGRSAKRGSFLYKSVNLASSTNALDSFIDISPDNVDYSGCLNLPAGVQNTSTYGCDGSGSSPQYRGIAYPKMFWMNDHFRLVYSVYGKSGRRNLYTAELQVNGASAATKARMKNIRVLSHHAHYAVANKVGNKIVVAFNYHPDGSIDNRTNLYALLLDGSVWKRWEVGNTNPVPASLPISYTTSSQSNPWLSNLAVKEYPSTPERGVYVKDVTMVNGKPLILYVGVLAKNLGNDTHVPHKDHDHYLAQAYWNGSAWQMARISDSVDHNYSSGSFYVRSSNDIRVIYPHTPDTKNNILAGGQMVSVQIVPGSPGYTNLVALTPSSSAVPGAPGYLNGLCEYNYARPVYNPHPDGQFVALFSGGNPAQYEGTPQLAHAPLFVSGSHAEALAKRLPMSGMGSGWNGLQTNLGCTP